MTVRGRQWTGFEAAALQEAMRRSVRDFAALLGVEPTTVVNWRTGLGAVRPRSATQAILDTTLDQRATKEDRARFEQLVSEGESAWRMRHPGVDAGPATDTPAAASEIHSERERRFELPNVMPNGHSDGGPESQRQNRGDPTNRREALHILGIGALASGVNMSGIVNGAARESTELMNAIDRSQVDPDNLHDAANELYRLASDYAVAPDVSCLFVQLTALRDQLAAEIRRTGRVTDLRDLYVLFSATCVLLASVSHDLAEPQAAMTQTRAARRFAELAGHRPLLSWVYCTRAMITSWWGRPEQVLREVARVGVKTGIAGVRLAGLEARANAQCGDRAAALAGMRTAGNARACLTRTDELAEFGPIFTFSPARQHYYDATTFARLGEWSSAQREAEAVIHQYGPNPAASWPVTLTLAQTNLAQARLHLEGPREALDTLLPAMEVPAVQRLPQFRSALRSVHDDLTVHPASTTADGRAMRDVIRSFAMDTTITKVDDGGLA